MATDGICVLVHLVQVNLGWLCGVPQEAFPYHCVKLATASDSGHVEGAGDVWKEQEEI
jgi:hypothetical protein